MPAPVPSWPEVLPAVLQQRPVSPVSLLWPV